MIQQNMKLEWLYKDKCIITGMYRKTAGTSLYFVNLYSEENTLNLNHRDDMINI